MSRRRRDRARPRPQRRCDRPRAGARSWRGDVPLPARAQGLEGTVVDAREAFRRHDRNRLAALRAAGRGRAEPARDVGRLLGADEPGQRGRAGRVRGVRTALERHLRRRPDAQRLAARARAPARQRHLRRRVPALSHERRPRGHLLRARQRPARRQGRARGRRSPRWLAQKDADDGCALSGRDARRRQAADPGRRLEEGARQHRGQPAARGAPGGRADLRARRQRARRDHRQPAPISRKEGKRRDAVPMPS